MAAEEGDPHALRIVEMVDDHDPEEWDGGEGLPGRIGIGGRLVGIGDQRWGLQNRVDHIAKALVADCTPSRSPLHHRL